MSSCAAAMLATAKPATVSATPENLMGTSPTNAGISIIGNPVHALIQAVWQ
jgi:hypothetical protein